MSIVEVVEQNLVALSHGHNLRIERAQLMRALRRRELDPVPLVMEPPTCLLTMFTFDFLWEVPRIGPHAVKEINRRAIKEQVNLAVTLGELTPMRRRWLATAIANRPDRPRPAPTGVWPLAARPQG